MSRTSRPRHSNRIRRVMSHCPRYAFRPFSRLAADSGVSHSAISRLVRNESEPTFRTMVLVTAALERRLGMRIDPRDLLTYSFGYPTATACELTGCRGCAYSPRRRHVTEKA